MLQFLRKREMIPMVTLHHFTDPLWLTKMGGWENEKTPIRFVRYARKVVEELKDYVDLWCPINEPNVYMYSGYVEGIFPPGKKDLKSGFRVLSNLVKGHARAYDAIHEIQPQASVGISIHYRSLQPDRNWFPLDKCIARMQSRFFNDAFPHAIAGGRLNFLFVHEDIPEAYDKMDFLGLQYYTRDLVKFSLNTKSFLSKRHFPKGVDISPTGFIANVPEGMFEALKWAKTFNKPIYITENGVEDLTDKIKPRFIIEHILQVWRAVNFNYPIKGYYYWTLVDNFEWERGWTQPFGLWGLNTKTQERVHRKSVDVYAAICRENGISSKMVYQHSPEIFGKIFPG
jgi:beta-glucosidase